ncbi:hypothetical protein B0A52_01213 [Exophiala mesophila]|uniref:Xylanolytic transcriptional activator regulatory domain-containing protein n=1 Tax=Exophiala mesophila TaxID=212818 RepID=A0A438NGV5_EXOME|nr:hypothetical protein B0A52_01213 [Exophiala mesophila]
MNEKDDDNQNGLQEPTPTSTSTSTGNTPIPLTVIEDNSTGYRGSSRSLDLPPLRQVLNAVHLFLEKSNSILPLFHRDTLLELVHDTYKVNARHRDPVAWAAINVVLALAHQQRLMGSNSIDQALKYLSRAQSALSDVVLKGTELLNVQVLVGMVMLLQSAEDIQPAVILIATTIRLAHRIGLHNRASAAHVGPIDARQRGRVFWLAYILDKDLSLRSKQPSIQRDDDIDLELPYPSEDQQYQTSGHLIDQNDGSVATTTFTADEAVKMNYFVSRIHLAVIQGGMYDYLHSTAAQKRSAEERSHALQSISTALEQWKLSTPLEFSQVEALQALSPATLWFLGSLKAASLQCTTLLNQADAWNSEWVTSLRKCDNDGTIPELPSQWAQVVDEGRHLLVLNERLGDLDRWSFWSRGCSYMTAMLLLIANTMHNPRHELAADDDPLVQAALVQLDRIVDETKVDRLRSFHDICLDLHQHAQQKRRDLMTWAELAANEGDLNLNFLDPGWTQNGLLM